MFTYILKSKTTKRFYVGHCSKLNERLLWHNLGLTKSTKYGIPWEIVDFEKKEDRSQAILREKQIKSYKGGNAFKTLIGGVA